MFLFALAQLLESYSVERARRAIRSLMAIAPREATVVRDGVEVRLPIGKVKVGDTVRVRPGEQIAIDGGIERGETEVDQAPITGESMPVFKTAGDQVFAGTINGTGAIDVRVTRAGQTRRSPASSTSSSRRSRSARPRRPSSIASRASTRPSSSRPRWW